MNPDICTAEEASKRLAELISNSLIIPIPEDFDGVIRIEFIPSYKIPFNKSTIFIAG